MLRAYLEVRNGNVNESLRWLEQHFGELKEDVLEPLNCADFLNQLDCFLSLNPSIPFWTGFTRLLQQAWPDSAAALYMRGLFARVVQGESEEAIDCFVAALNQDQTFWMAAREMGDICLLERNWWAARAYYEQALAAELAQEEPDLHFFYAWGLAKLKEHTKAEEHYRLCLQLDDNQPDARNGLGWALVQQGKLEASLPFFEEAIERKESGSYPIHNKAVALTRLKRFPEAIAAWEAVGSGKRAQREIARIQNLLKQGATSFYRPAEEEIALNVDEAEETEAEETEEDVEPQVVLSVGKTSRLGKNSAAQRPMSAADREIVLEEMLERCIQRGEMLFGRRLRMYGDATHRLDERPYGRQYVISRVGRIDLLTVDVDSGELVIIELKRGASDEEVVSQLTRYLDWANNSDLAHRDLAHRGVRGIICVHSASPKLVQAAKEQNNIEVFRYALQIVPVSATGTIPDDIA